MKLKHYATFWVKDKSFFPQDQTFNLPTNDIKNIQIPENAIKIVTFDRLVGKVEHEGKKYDVATKELNVKTYHIGNFRSMSEYVDKGNFYKALAEIGAKGMVITRDGKDNIVYKDDLVIEPKYISKDGYFTITPQTKEDNKEPQNEAKKPQTKTRESKETIF